MSETDGKTADGSALLTTEQAAAILRWLPDTVRRKAGAGELPALLVGRRWVFDRAKLHAFIRGEWTPGKAPPSVP